MITIKKKFIFNDNSGSYFEIFLIVTLILIALKTSYSQTATWDGSSSTDWNTAANWSTNSVPTSSNDVIIPDVTNDPIITSSSDVCQNLTIQSGGILTSNNGSYKLTTASITVNDGGSLVISDGEVESSGDADFSGDLTMSGGLLDVDGEFDMLSTGDGRNISDGNITAKQGRFNYAEFFQPSGGTFTFDVGYSGILSMHSSSHFHNIVIDIGSSYSLTTLANFDVNGTLTLTSGSLDISSYTVTVSGETDIKGTLIISTGIFDANGAYKGGGGGAISFTGAGFLKCAASVYSLGSMNSNIGTVVFDKTSGTQNVRPDTYYNLTIDGNATHQIGSSSINVLGNLVVNQNGSTVFDTRDLNITVSGTADINGTLDIGTGTFDANGTFDATGGSVTFTDAGQLNLAGTVTSLGTFTRSTGTVEYDGSSSQTMSGVDYYNLIVNNSSEITMGANASVFGTLTFTSGDVTTNSNTLTIGASGSVSGADASKHINGHCAKITSSTSAFTFPVGDGTRYRPIILTPAASNSNTFSVKYNHSAHSDVSIAGGSTIDHISPQYHWDINRTSGSDNATISVVWTSSSTYGTENWNHDISTMLWAYFDGADWNSIGSTSSGNSNSGSLTTSSANSNWSNENFTLAATTATYPPLPIDLISFDGHCNNHLTQIQFTVASQVNNDYFTIERSTNIMDWEIIGFIAGGLTTNELITYNWSDEAPLNGTKYYRLSQTDINGEVKYFNPIALECENEIDFNLYPNPANESINIALNFDYSPNEETYINIRNLRGEIIKSVPVFLNRGYNNLEIDCKDIPKGIYLVMIKGLENFRPEKRLIKM